MNRLTDLLKDIMPMGITATTGALASLSATGALQIVGWLVSIAAGITTIAMMWTRKRFYKREMRLRDQNRFRYMGKQNEDYGD